jgi:hypothetical protein
MLGRVQYGRADRTTTVLRNLMACPNLHAFMRLVFHAFMRLVFHALMQ